MKTFLLCFLLSASFGLTAAEKAAVVPHPVTATFYIGNVQCAACADSISESVRKVKSVSSVKLEPSDGFALIAFDTHVSSYHQIAQAIADASPIHSEKYVPSLRFSVAEYSKGENAAKVDAIFAKRKDWVKVECTNRAKGEFKLTFLPLKAESKAGKPQGWNAGHFGHAVSDPAPKGLGLKFVMKREGTTKPASN